jgi:hypothetical protein
VSVLEVSAGAPDTGRTSSSREMPVASQMRSSRGRLNDPRERMRLTEGSLSEMRLASMA